MQLLTFGSTVLWFLVALSAYIVFVLVRAKWAIRHWQQCEQNFSEESVYGTRDDLPRSLKRSLASYEDQILAQGYKFFAIKKKTTPALGKFFHVIFVSDDMTTLFELTSHQPSFCTRGMKLLCFDRTALDRSTFALSLETHYSNGNLACTLTLDSCDFPLWVHAQTVSPTDSISEIVQEHSKLLVSLPDSDNCHTELISSIERYTELENRVRMRLAAHGQKKLQQFIEEYDLEWAVGENVNTPTRDGERIE